MDKIKTTEDNTTSSKLLPNPLLAAVPSLMEIVKLGKVFVKDIQITENGFICYTEQHKKGWWEGYVIKLKYLHEVGYFFDYNPFKSSYEFLNDIFKNNDSNATADVNTAMKWLGVCPTCQTDLFDAFSWKLHNINECGKTPKKAVAMSSEA